jgi:23S rRNA (uracil747-C5)-methyltransferase
MDVPYAQQLALKESKLSNALIKFGLNPRISTFYRAPEPFGYRNKAKFIVAGTIDNPVIGMADAHQRVVDLPKCPLHDSTIVQLAPYLKESITKFKLTPYDIQTRQGELKGIIVRVGAATNDISLRFVMRSRSLEKRLISAATELQSAFPNLKVISINIQPKPAAILEGTEEIILSQELRISEILGGFHLGVSPQSFSQVSSRCAEALYKRGAEFVAEAKPNILLDLFCGTGCFSIFASKYFGSGLGIEISSSSIKDATFSAELNQIHNVTYREGDVSDFKKHLGANKPDFIIINPPRRGLGEKLCSEIKGLAPKNILYSSCNAETMAADLACLREYQIKSCEIFDMFPLTEHFETLAMLAREGA